MMGPRVCRDCGEHVESWESMPTMHGACLQARQIRLLDYGPHIRPGVRVIDARKMRAGRVLLINDGCHWNCQPSSEAWRPRSAYVLFDGASSRQSTWGRWGIWGPPVSYLGPDDLEVIPETWGTGGVIDLRRVAERARPFGRCIARPGANGSVWLLDEKTLKVGWAAKGYSYSSWSGLFDAWDVLPVGESDVDDTGPWLRVEPVPPAEKVCDDGNDCAKKAASSIDNEVAECS
jgi:hypothetical protein